MKTEAKWMTVMKKKYTSIEEEYEDARRRCPLS